MKIGSDTFFEAGVKVEKPDTRDFEKSGNNKGVKDALQEYEYDLSEEYGAIPNIVSQMQAGSTSELPSWITEGPVYKNKIEESTQLKSDTLYVVKDVADLGSDRKVSKVAIVQKRKSKSAPITN